MDSINWRWDLGCHLYPRRLCSQSDLVFIISARMLNTLGISSLWYSEMEMFEKKIRILIIMMMIIAMIMMMMLVGCSFWQLLVQPTMKILLTWHFLSMIWQLSIWYDRSWSTLVQVMVSCLIASSLYLNVNWSLKSRDIPMRTISLQFKTLYLSTMIWMAWCKTAVTPVCKQWSYCSLGLSPLQAIDVFKNYI